MRLEDRIDQLLAQHDLLAPWVGKYTAESLAKLLNSEFGDARRLHSWIDKSRVQPLSPLLHILSGNTQHAAFQSLFRAFLLGCSNWVKIPACGLPEFEHWAKSVPDTIVADTLSDTWKEPEAAVIYGDDTTLDFFRDWLKPATRMILHGPALSAAFIYEADDELFGKLAIDILSHGQRGCLSLQVIYCAPEPISFCEKLATALRSYRPYISDLTTSGAVRNERELSRFRIANQAKMGLWESEGTTDWTIVYDAEDLHLRMGPGGGFVRVSPLPESLDAKSLGPEATLLSTAVLSPFSSPHLLDDLSPPRICPPGRAQNPPLLWHPDGYMPLGSLVRWRDLG